MISAQSPARLMLKEKAMQLNSMFSTRAFTPFKPFLGRYSFTNVAIHFSSLASRYSDSV